MLQGVYPLNSNDLPSYSKNYFFVSNLFMILAGYLTDPKIFISSKLEIHTYPLLFVKVAFTWGAREGPERAHHFQTSVSDCRGFSFEEFVTGTQINSIKHLTLVLSGVLHTYGIVKWNKARIDI